jgi:hypothetical protein
MRESGTAWPETVVVDGVEYRRQMPVFVSEHPVYDWYDHRAEGIGEPTGTAPDSFLVRYLGHLPCFSGPQSQFYVTMTWPAADDPLPAAHVAAKLDQARRTLREVHRRHADCADAEA